MNVVFLGFSRFWFEYLSQLLPEAVTARRLTVAGEISEIPAESLIFLDQTDQIDPQVQEKLVGARRLLRIHRPGMEVSGPIAAAGTVLVCIDSSLEPQVKTDLEQLPLVCGASTEGPFRTRMFDSGEPVVVGVLTDSDNQISLPDWSGKPHLVKKEIQVGRETPLVTLIADIEQCDILVEAMAPGSYPGLASWLALAQGRAVICDLSALKKRALTASERLLPIIDSSAENLDVTIDALVRDPRTLRDLSRRGIDFITSYRRLERSQAQMARILTNK